MIRASHKRYWEKACRDIDRREQTRPIELTEKEVRLLQTLLSLDFEAMGFERADSARALSIRTKLDKASK